MRVEAPDHRQGVLVEVAAVFDHRPRLSRMQQKSLGQGVRLTPAVSMQKLDARIDARLRVDVDRGNPAARACLRNQNVREPAADLAPRPWRLPRQELHAMRDVEGL